MKRYEKTRDQVDQLWNNATFHEEIEEIVASHVHLTQFQTKSGESSRFNI